MSKKKNKKKGQLALAGRGIGFFESELPAGKKKGFLETTPALVIGAVGGAFAGAAMGKPSFYSGIATTVVGALAKIPVITHFGIGMTVSGGYQSLGLSGAGLNGAKERIKAFVEDFKQRMYLDKVFKPKQETLPGIEGFGNVQYFRYPLEGPAQLDMSALDKIQRELEASAQQFQQNNLNGVYENMLAEDRNY